MLDTEGRGKTRKRKDVTEFKKIKKWLPKQLKTTQENVHI